MAALDPALIRKQLNRIARSCAFAQAGRMFPLLEYLVDAELSAAGSPLNQRRIAVDVFGRDEGFDPTCDAIVRVEVGRLRNKLREYYATDGRTDELVVVVPKGRYKACILRRDGQGHADRSILPAQSIRRCRTPDGIELAYATLGEGYPLVALPHWMSHLEADFENPLFRHYWLELMQRFQLVRFDMRGFGLSARDVRPLAFDDLVTDLTTVVDALGLERFALLGPSGGGPVATAFAARQPDRVSHLLLLGSYIRGPRCSPDPLATQFADAFQSMIRLGWGLPDSRFRDVFSSMLVPDATAEQRKWMDDAQRAATSSGDDALRHFDVQCSVDLTDEASNIAAEALVFHGNERMGVPFHEAEYSAATIPRARLIRLPTENHLLMVDEPAWPIFLAEIDASMEGLVRLQTASM